MVLPAAPGLLGKPELRIPPGEPKHEVKGSLTIRQDSHLLAVFPHMHWLGKDFLLRGHPARRLAQTLIRIDDWDFNWQNPYEFLTPSPCPRGPGSRCWPTSIIPPATPATRASRRSRCAGARRRPTRCASASSSSPATPST